MSYFEDYIEDGLCCQSCGEFLGGDEPGYTRSCRSCEPQDNKKYHKQNKSNKKIKKKLINK